MTFIFREDTWKHWHQGFVIEMLAVEWCKMLEELEKQLPFEPIELELN